MGSQDDFFEALGPTENPPNDFPGVFHLRHRPLARGRYFWQDIRSEGNGHRCRCYRNNWPRWPRRQWCVWPRGCSRRSRGTAGMGSSAAACPLACLGWEMEPRLQECVGNRLGNPGVEGISNSAPGGVGAGPGVKGFSEDGIGLVGDGDVGAAITGRSNGLTVVADQQGLTVKADKATTIMG